MGGVRRVNPDLGDATSAHHHFVIPVLGGPLDSRLRGNDESRVCILLTHFMLHCGALANRLWSTMGNFSNIGRSLC
ncbi:hypothetical protein HNQ50_003844 [Silvimonas terrae]|uniref:Uncharacterized protein n=1 Tax=Silvimonas terrae TaxID=300266 RepID=A0A840RKU2_9NEIS|nr:hypothetical protein [Silvimonas terrae]